MTREQLTKVKTVVVKVGSSLLASINGGIDSAFIKHLVDQLARIRLQGIEVVLVSSGAVAAGTAELRLTERPVDLPEIQAAAAVGQTALMNLYWKAFAIHDITVGQVLLTRDGLQNRQRYLHGRNTLRVLLSKGVLPIVNENDTIAIEELKLKMGDNDGLAVSTSQLVEANCLILLTDVPGLYDRPPDHENAKLIHHVDKITSDLFKMASDSVSGLGLGGMSTKLDAARAASMAAIPLIVAPGNQKNVITDILQGREVGTFFAPRKKRTSLRQQWIAFGRKPEGSIVIDDGASTALRKGKKSLLAIGIIEIQGVFHKSDTVIIVNKDKEEVARGLTNFSTKELNQLIGKKSSEFSHILGCDCCETVVHRDNLVML